MKVIGLPKIEQFRRFTWAAWEFRCSDQHCFGIGSTRALAFDAWKDAKKQLPK